MIRIIPHDSTSLEPEHDARNPILIWFSRGTG